MHLAKVLSILFLLAWAGLWGAARPDRLPAGNGIQSAQDKNTPAQMPSGSSSSGTSSREAPISPAKPRRKHKKAPLPPDCSLPAAQNGSAPDLYSRCPPPKTVIRNGGTTEPPVQLEGGESAAHEQQKSNTDQLLGSTEDNLKKIAGHSLSPAQQEMVTQIRQYIAQSKEAVTSGDTERGHTLAQKARLLSDELAKP